MTEWEVGEVQRLRNENAKLRAFVQVVSGAMPPSEKPDYPQSEVWAVLDLSLSKWREQARELLAELDAQSKTRAQP